MDKRVNRLVTLAAVLILFNCFSTINGQLDCTGLQNGDYPDPADQCSGYFYTCSNGEASYIVCAQTGTVFDPTLGRCEYCELVYPCNADPDNIRCATSVFTTTARPAPTCPPYDPNQYICICSATSCQLELITTTAPPPPTCPPYDPSVYICVCNALTCQLELITTTAPPVTDPCPGVTRGTTIANVVYDCTSKPNGDYADPFFPCSGFFWSCTNGDAFYKECALQGTVFDQARIKCDYCANVYPCNVAF